MAVDNRLSTAQLNALGPGDAVTIECAGDSRRPRHISGTVVRAAGAHIVVSIKSAKGALYHEQYRRRDGVREGGSLVRAELVNANGTASPASRPTKHVDALYREWARHRSDVERLRRLRDAISECLDGSLVEQD